MLTTYDASLFSFVFRCPLDVLGLLFKENIKHVIALAHYFENRLLIHAGQKFTLKLVSFHRRKIKFPPYLAERM